VADAAETTGMTGRVRVTLFWIFVFACIGGAIGYVRWRIAATDHRTTPSIALYDPADPRFDDVRAAPHMFFLSAAAYGRVAVVRLANPAEQWVMNTPECERSHFDKNGGLCLVLNRESVQPRAFAYFLDAKFQTRGRLDLAGLPIRARISPDGKLGASTVFITGENYASEEFTTRTTLYDLSTHSAIADIEHFTVERDGKPFHDPDFNFWGVSFRRDSNHFVATLGTGGKRFLVEGDVARRHFRVVADDVECPSLSPDERHVVFKRHRTGQRGWQLWAMNLETRESWAITDEQQDIDDQVEWLDNDHVIYGMVLGPGPVAQNLGLWTTSIDRAAGKNQKFFLQSAWSPAVIR
jgi:hypothetical protein